MSLLSSLLRSRRVATHVTALVGLAGLATFSSARAAVPTVVANDTFTIELEAYNSTNTSGNFYVIQPDLAPTFGTTQTFTGDAFTNQVLTTTSTQTISGNTFTDTITISVPTNFLPAGTKDKNGNLADTLVFSIGNYNISANGVGNPLDFTSALSGITITGTVKYSGGTVNIPNAKQGPLFANGNTSLSDLYAINVPVGTDIGTLNVTTFTITITNAVPEPSPVGAVLLGACGLIGFMVVRRRRGLA